MKNSMYCLIVAATFILTACGESSSKVKHYPGTLAPETKTQGSDEKSALDNNFTYEFKTDECTTGKHELKSNEELCLALQDETLNNSCEVQQREMRFALDCQGQTFTPFTDTGIKKEDVTTKAIKAGEHQIVMHKNADDESVKTIVYCLESKENIPGAQEDITATTESNGRTSLVDGTNATFSNDESAIYEDGTSISGKMIIVTCEKSL